MDLIRLGKRKGLLGQNSSRTTEFLGRSTQKLILQIRRTSDDLHNKKIETLISARQHIFVFYAKQTNVIYYI